MTYRHNSCRGCISDNFGLSKKWQMKHSHWNWPGNITQWFWYFLFRVATCHCCYKFIPLQNIYHLLYPPIIIKMKSPASDFESSTWCCVNKTTRKLFLKIVISSMLTSYSLHYSVVSTWTTDYWVVLILFGYLRIPGDQHPQPWTSLCLLHLVPWPSPGVLAFLAEFPEIKYCKQVIQYVFIIVTSLKLIELSSINKVSLGFLL